MREARLTILEIPPHQSITGVLAVGDGQIGVLLAHAGDAVLDPRDRVPVRHAVGPGVERQRLAVRAHDHVYRGRVLARAAPRDIPLLVVLVDIRGVVVREGFRRAVASLGVDG